MKKQIEIGLEINDWTVVKTGIVKNAKRHATIRCRCGKERDVQERYIMKSKISQSCRACGQLRRRESCRAYNVGDTFMNLQVLSIYSGKTVSYKVKCLNCGNKYHTGHSILNKKKNGRGLSCCHLCFDVNAKSKKKNTMLTENISLTKFNNICHTAFLRGISFEVDANYLEKIFTGRCALSGVPIEIETLNVIKGCKHKGSASLDRINSNVGYVEGNLQWVHKDINLMKNKLCEKLFVDYCVKVSNHANQQPSLGGNTLEGSETTR